MSSAVVFRVLLLLLLAGVALLSSGAALKNSPPPPPPCCCCSLSGHAPWRWVWRRGSRPPSFLFVSASVPLAGSALLGYGRFGVCVCWRRLFFSSSSSFSSSFRSGAREKTLLRSLFGDDGADRDVAVTRLRQQKKRKHKKRAKKTNKTKHSIQAIDPSAPMNGGDCLETRRKTSSALGHG